ncbi:unnamed protein product [Calypogeia fissa]
MDRDVVEATKLAQAALQDSMVEVEATPPKRPVGKPRRTLLTLISPKEMNQVHEGYKYREAVTYLQRRWPMTNVGPGLFDRLNESTVRGWFMPDGKTFKDTVLLAIDNLNFGGGEGPANLKSIANGQKIGLWEGKQELEDEWQSLLVHQRENGQVVNSLTTYSNLVERFSVGQGT